jgi:hypothetical protein
MNHPRHFLMREVRFGPLVPARLYWLDHEPGEPSNKREGSRWPVYIACADVAGVEVEPERITDRMHRPASHWGALQPIAEADYRYQLARLRWAEGSAPDDPTLRSRRKVDPASVKLPTFEREQSL